MNRDAIFAAHCDRLNVRMLQARTPWVYERHMAAVAHPERGYERAILRVIRSLAELAEFHEERYAVPIASDWVFGPAWLDMARGFLVMLKGETGARLYRGTLDGTMRDLAKAAGFAEEL